MDIRVVERGELDDDDDDDATTTTHDDGPLRPFARSIDDDDDAKDLRHRHSLTCSRRRRR
jgi:hypothetical protein